MTSLPSSDPAAASVAPAQSKTCPGVAQELQKSNISEQRRAQNVMVRRAIRRTHDEASKERMLGRRLLFTASKTTPGLEDITKVLGSSPLKHCPKMHVEVQAAEETQDAVKSDLEKEEMDEDQGRKRQNCVKLLCQLFVLQRRQNLLVCGLSKAERLQYERDQEKRKGIMATSTDTNESTKSET